MWMMPLRVAEQVGVNRAMAKKTNTTIVCSTHQVLLLRPRTQEIYKLDFRRLLLVHYATPFPEHMGDISENYLSIVNTLYKLFKIICLGTVLIKLGQLHKMGFMAAVARDLGHQVPHQADYVANMRLSVM